MNKTILNMNTYSHTLQIQPTLLGVTDITISVAHSCVAYIFVCFKQTLWALKNAPKCAKLNLVANRCRIISSGNLYSTELTSDYFNYFCDILTIQSSQLLVMVFRRIPFEAGTIEGRRSCSSKGLVALFSLGEIQTHISFPIYILPWTKTIASGCKIYWLSLSIAE